MLSRREEDALTQLINRAWVAIDTLEEEGRPTEAANLESAIHDLEGVLDLPCGEEEY